METNEIDRLIDQEVVKHDKQISGKPSRPTIDAKDITEELEHSFREALEGIDDPDSGKALMRIHTGNPINVKKMRKEIGLTQTRLADLVGVNLSTIQHWEHGSRQPKSASKIVLEAIAAAARKKKEE